MKCNLIIDKNRDEEVTVYAHRKTRLVTEIERLCKEGHIDLIGYKGNEIVRFDLRDVCCFTVENGKVFALTLKEKLYLKCRLYVLEDELSESFVKVNKSCIANIKMIDRFDATFSGALSVRFKNGFTDYVSRRCLKNVKERLGI